MALIATGDELVPPGDVPTGDQIFASSLYGVAAILGDCGAAVIDCGIARDTLEDLDAALGRAEAARADVVITLGGASVGEHDLVGPAFAARGVTLSFEKVAMRPGKPLMHGRGGGRYYLGLPGNPVSSLVCARLFARALVLALQGRPTEERWIDAVLAAALPPNDEREEFMRARIDDPSIPAVVALDRQDSSLVSRYAAADVLLHRLAHAPAGKPGDRCRVIPIVPGAL